MKRPKISPKLYKGMLKREKERKEKMLINNTYISLYAIFNTKLNTWVKIYEEKEYRYYFTSKEVDEIYKEYEKNKDKSIGDIVVFNINNLIKNIYVDTGIIEEAGL